MPENNELFPTVIRDAGRAAWVYPEEVRRRGTRRRIRKRAVAAGLAALIVTGIGVGAAWGLGGPYGGPDMTATPAPSRSAEGSPTTDASPDPGASPTPPPASATPPPSSPPPPVPEAVMLRISDVAGAVGSSDDVSDDHGSIVMLIYYCGQGGYTTADEHWLAARRRSLDAGADRYVHEEVSRYEGSWAGQHLADLRAVLPRCPTVDLRVDPPERITLTVVATDFTGDGSFLVKEVRGTQTQYHAVIHRGDLLARLRIHNGATEAQARNIARRASDRLCAALPGC